MCPQTNEVIMTPEATSLQFLTMLTILTKLPRFCLQNVILSTSTIYYAPAVTHTGRKVYLQSHWHMLCSTFGSLSGNIYLDVNLILLSSCSVLGHYYQCIAVCISKGCHFIWQFTFETYTLHRITLLLLVCTLHCSEYCEMFCERFTT
uniref:Uncharacterized protein n=1 Tax=Rhipicephalus zambeziensis TaxID=60191 RepID=A0A224Y7E0_9ACAR